jgi:hypothetical protein
LCFNWRGVLSDRSETTAMSISTNNAFIPHHIGNSLRIVSIVKLYKSLGCTRLGKVVVSHGIWFLVSKFLVALRNHIDLGLDLEAT